jgi:hypothetical protein
MVPNLFGGLVPAGLSKGRMARSERGARLVSRQIRLRRARSSGTSLIETLAGFIIILPIALVALDLTMVVSASQINEHLVEDAARAAANQVGAQNAQAAAQTALQSYQINPPIVSVVISDFNYNPPLTGEMGGGNGAAMGANGGMGENGAPMGANAGMVQNGAPMGGNGGNGQNGPPAGIVPTVGGQVSVVTSMVIKLPVPIAKIEEVTVRADAVQPIVAIPAPE